MARLVRGDVHLVRFGAPDKERPALILTRETSLGRLTQITVAPITSTIRGVPSEVILDATDGMKSPSAINLFNVGTVPETLIGRRVSALSAAKLKEVCAALRFALGCD